MEDFQKKGLELVVGLAVTEKKNPEVIPYQPQKLFVSGAENQYFKRRIGGKKHAYARLLTDLLYDLEKEKAANVHNIMVIKDGEVILEASAPGYDVNCAHLAHSMSKTVTAIAIGMLVDDGKISVDENIIGFFPELETSDKRFESITVEHLLEMKSGVPFGELGTVTSDKWCESFFLSELNAEPGESFAYNSMNSYILANIVARVSGKSVTEFVTERLLTPLHIDNFFWELSPEDVEKGGMGIYMSAESFAKIGLMLLNRGRFEDKVILSEDFVSKMIYPHSLAPLDKGDFNYGYHLWVGRENNEFLLSGMLGQIVWISPNHNIVAAINSGNNEVFQDSAALRILRKHLADLPENTSSTLSELAELKKASKNFFVDRHWIKPLKPQRCLLTALGFKDPMPFDTAWNKILGDYAFPNNNISLLPLLVTVMQNNYSGGIDRISITRDGNALMLTAIEGGREFCIPIGLYDFIPSIQNYDGEDYKICAIAEAIEDEDRNPVFKIELVFPELPNTRMIKIYPLSDGIRLRLAETPNNAVAERFIGSMMNGGKMEFAMNMIERKVGEDFIERKLEGMFNPILLGVNMSIDGWQNRINEMNAEKAEQNERSGRLVRTMVSRFVDPAALTPDGVAAAPEKKKGENFLGKAITSILSRRKKNKNNNNNYTEIHVIAPTESSNADNTSE
jgi:hypothetical protein